MNPIVSALVAAVTLINIVAVVLLFFWQRRGSKERPGTTQTTGHVWDEDLRELNNPLPLWWLGLFALTVIFGLGYLVVYPGLGNWAGTSRWTSHAEYRAQNAQAEALLARTLAPFAQQSVTQLAGNPDALRVGRNLFMNNCATCHGSDARGAPGFPDLTDHDWLWGGTPEAIVQTISYGRTSIMPPWRDALGGDDGVEDVVAYVLSLSGRHAAVGDVSRGQAKFQTICIACHGPDGRGNQTLGAPNLTDRIWLNGGAVSTVRETIALGRQAAMPAQLERLGETRVKLLAAYVISLGGAQLSPAPAREASIPAGAEGTDH
jgi:cytochrome c oxidase cbb3-type subunit 3